MQTEAYITTEFAEDYLRQMCLHFARRVPTTLVGNQGIIDFPFGRCRLDSHNGGIRLYVDLKNDNDRNLAEDLLSRSLLNIARQEQPRIRRIRKKRADGRLTPPIVP